MIPETSYREMKNVCNMIMNRVVRISIPHYKDTSKMTAVFGKVESAEVIEYPKFNDVGVYVRLLNHLEAYFISHDCLDDISIL